MSLDLTGIINDNEFYTQHYLATLLEGDLKALAKSWQEDAVDEDAVTPDAALRALAKPYGQFRNKLNPNMPAEGHLQLLRPLFASFAAAMGYAVQPFTWHGDGETAIPVRAQVCKPDGAPLLFFLEAVDREDGGGDPLECPLLACQFDEAPALEPGRTWDDLITKVLFAAEEPPRWVLLFSAWQWVLIDRGKWGERRLLRFDLGEILARKDVSTLRATAALLHKDSLCPESGTAFLDVLDENAHKHAHAVSEDLKYALREAIELMGNEAIHYLREVRRDKVFQRPDLADQLSRECLRTMYRLLFLFYIEARPDLGYAPMKSPIYLRGYSLERLRDLERVKLTTEAAKDGYYLHHSIAKLFALVFQGFPVAENYQAQQLSLEGRSEVQTFRMPPLKSHLFDPAKTPLLNKVKLRNFVWQRIIELMSLSRPKKTRRGKSARRGRVSYAQLGINQLGAVYEALLSFRGFFADTDLYEVVKKGTMADPLETGYFVAAEDLEKYSEDEKVYRKDEHGDRKLVKYEKGRFIYRLAGRDREQSASYYTPEVLTRCLVKYALKELLKDKRADDILELTLCEPAMGSAAFLNEAINQLAEAYLDRKQRETGRRIDHERYKKELQRVKMFIADKRVFGVDLNPVAVELAEVSLWLNSISPGGFIPWFGNQLVCGNSLVGARREVYATSLLAKDKGKTKAKKWHDEPPSRVMPGTQRPEHAVYHFLVADGGMAFVNDKVIKGLAPEAVKKMAVWRKAFCQPYSDEELKTLCKLSELIDLLWQRHVEMRRTIWSRTDDPLTVWPQPEPADGDAPRNSTARKDEILEGELLTRNVRNSSPYRRLKLAMDYWCALWFWPVQQADQLPTRTEFLTEMSLLILGEAYQAQVDVGEQFPLFADTQSEEEAKAQLDAFGYVNVDALCAKNPRLQRVADLAERYRFLHWELEFADVFAERGGFDLIIGNPPWIKVEWQEGGVLGDSEPEFVLHKISASNLAKLRADLLQADSKLKDRYFAAFETANGTQNFLNGLANYPLLKGMQTNLYKCFLPLAWGLGSSQGMSGFVHPEGVYDDPKGGRLRRALYQRLHYHFQFQNEWPLFHGTNDHGRLRFGVHLFQSRPNATIHFYNMSNLFYPTTIDDSFQEKPGLLVPGIKNEQNKWNTDGHPDRLVHVDETTLKLFADLYDKPGTPPLEARLPALHAQTLVGVLQKFAQQPKRLGDLAGSYYATVMWDETNRQKDGTIRRETQFPADAGQWILSGPHFFVATPFNKTPRTVCEANGHYDVLDLTELPEDYLPRTNYVPACDATTYLERTPTVPWDKSKPVTEFFRFSNREMLSQAGERTLIPILTPPLSGHVNTLISIIFRDKKNLINLFALSISIPIDFRVKSTGMGHANQNVLSQLPIHIPEKYRQQMWLRALRLNCLSQVYAPLWEEAWSESWTGDAWVEEDARLGTLSSHLGQSWTWDTPIRNAYARRQALVEIDVLAAMALGLTLEELQTIYRIQFPVMQQYEADTWYDQNGRIVFTNNKGLPGVGLPRKGNAKKGITGWEDVRHMTEGTLEQTVEDDTLPGGPRQRTITYVAPFERCDRVADYRQAWAVFSERLAAEGTES